MRGSTYVHYVFMYMHVFDVVGLCRQLSAFCDSYVKSIAETEVNHFKDYSRDYFLTISQGNVRLII